MTAPALNSDKAVLKDVVRILVAGIELSSVGVILN